MTFLSTSAINTSIERIDKLVYNLASMRPTEDFTRDDINATMMYLCHYQDDLKKEIKQRQPNK